MVNSKTVVSFITLLMFVTGTVLTAMGVFQSTETGLLKEEFIIPSEVFNTLAVMFLLYLASSNSEMSPSYQFMIVILLVSGLIIEIYLTMYSENKGESIASYIFIALNFFIRSFFLIELIQGDWVRPFKQPIQEIVKEVTSSTIEEPKKVTSEIENKWRDLKNILRSRPEGLSPESQSIAWKSVISPAKESGREDVKTVLREALGVLKDKDGNSIPFNVLDKIGGSRK